MNIGMFLNNVISFLIVAVAVFVLVKGDQRAEEALREAEAEKPPPPPPPSEVYLKEIRDALVKK